jgi:hypothetical protein
VLLATLDVPFSEEATAFAVDSAVENGRPLVLVNAAQVLLTPYTLLGYGYVEREDLQAALRKPAELARSLAVPVERLRVCSPHPVDALLEVVAERSQPSSSSGPTVRLAGPPLPRAGRAVRERAPTRLGQPDVSHSVQ